MGIVIKRPVHVKVVVTESFRDSRLAQIRAAIAKLDAVGRQLAVNIESRGDDEVRPRLDEQAHRNKQAKAALKHEADGISALELGAEHGVGVLEGTVEVDVGDDFSLLKACEIVVKDDIIIEIRDGGRLDESQ